MNRLEVIIMDLLAKNVNVNLLCVMFLNVHVLNSMVMFKNNQTTWPYFKKK